MNQSAENSALLSKGISSNAIYDSFIDKIAQVSSKESLDLVDIGCGTGNLIQSIKSSLELNSVTGIDIIDYKHDNHEKQFSYIKQNLNENFKFEQKFDISISSEVIEHLENPRHFLRQLKNITKDSGYIIISTPNPISWLSKLSFCLKGFHSSFGPKDYPAHITPITPYQFTNMINEIEGLKLQSIHYLNNGRIPGTSLHWKKILPFLKGKGISDNYIVVIERY